MNALVIRSFKKRSAIICGRKSQKQFYALHETKHATYNYDFAVQFINLKFNTKLYFIRHASFFRDSRHKAF